MQDLPKEPYDPSELERLKQAYAELELRVTRFSSVEQALINTRDRLDEELEMYKRFLHFTNAALQDQTGYSFIRLVAESIVDIFELEYAIIHFVSDPEFKGVLTFVDDQFVDGEEQAAIVQAIDQWQAHIPVGSGALLTGALLESTDAFRHCSEVLCNRVDEPAGRFTCYLFGVVSKRQAPLYSKPKQSYPTIFSILGQQVKSWFLLRQKRKLIDQQVLQIEEADRELRKLSLIATKTKNGVVIADGQGRIEWVNESFVTTTGYTLEEVKGKKPKDFLQGPDSDSPARRRIGDALWQRENVEVTIVNYTKEGQPYYNQLEITPVFDEQGRHLNFIALQKDITTEIKAQQEILRVNNRFEKVTARSAIGVWEWVISESRLIWNAVMLEIFGAPSTLHEDDWATFFDQTLHPEDKERVVDDINRLTKGQGTTTEHEFRIFKGPNKEQRILRAFIVLECNEAGEPERLLGTTVDITEKRNYDLRIIQKNEELRKINAELDNFVYSISHDLRSPLLSIKGILNLVKDTPELTDKSRNFLQLASTSADRLDHTIQEILDYSRNTRLELKVSSFDVVELVESVFNDLRFSSSLPIHFIVNIAGERIVETDHYRLNTLLKNIIGNAVKYHRADVADPYVNVSISHLPGLLDITVSDNGQGIDDAHLLKVFDMFYRANSKVHGTGLGLYICKEIVSKLGGKIQIDSVVNQGTTIRFTAQLTP